MGYSGFLSEHVDTISSAEAAEILGMSESHVREHAADYGGKLMSVRVAEGVEAKQKVWRFDQAEIEAILEEMDS
jgi:hypothetical protein